MAWPILFAPSVSVCSDGFVCDFPTIQAAVDAGQTSIWLGAGTYGGFSVVGQVVTVFATVEGAAITGPISVSAAADLTLEGVAVSVEGADAITCDTSTLRLVDAAIGDLLLLAPQRGLDASVCTVTAEASAFGPGAAAEGALVRLAGGSFTATDTSFTGGVSSGDGGAIDATEAVVDLTAGVITLSAAAGGSGGAIHADRSTLTLSGTSLKSNAASGYGGAIRALDSTVTLEEVQASFNSAGQHGGALASSTSDFALLGGTYELNSTTGDGGVIDLQGGSVVLMPGYEGPLQLVSNSATYGGAVWASGAAVTAEAVVLNGNHTTLHGGSLWLQDCPSPAVLTELDGLGGSAAYGGYLATERCSVTLDGGQLADATATGLGGAVFAGEGSELTALDTTFVGNTATHGGDVALWGADGGVLEGVEASLSVAYGAGGSVYAEASPNVEVRDATFTYPYAGEGGAVAIRDGSVAYIEGSDFVGAVAAGDGGAIHVLRASVANVAGATFTGGWGYRGGAIAVWEGTLSVVDSDFVGPSAYFGGAIDLGFAAGSWVDGNRFESTFAPEGGAVRLASDSVVELRRNQFCGTSGSVGGAVLVEGTASLHSVSDVFVAVGGGGAPVAVDGTGISTVTHATIRDPVGPVATAGYGSALLLAGTVISDDRPEIDGPVQLDGVASDNPIVLSGGAAGDVRLEPIGWLVGAEPAALPCSVETRIHPQSAQFQSWNKQDLGAYDGAEADPDWLVDLDGDTSPWRYDCDDADPSVGGLTVEICDGVDQDCDGLVDETGFWPDADGDGWGAEGPPVDCGDDRTGWVGVSGDCDDTDPEVHPAAIELCDGVDQDCDGATDEDGAPQSWLVDQDGDSFGAGDPITACAPPTGAVAPGPLDCDDQDPAAYPGAPEIAGDGVDQDCDGLEASWGLSGGTCGCAGSGGSAGWLALAFAAVTLRRRAAAR